MGPEVVAAASVAGLALEGGSKVMGGLGEQASQDFLAKRDERASAIGRIKADQTDVFLREELNRTLANIDSVRGAANIDPTSPTTAALKGEATRISDRERNIRVGNIEAQASEDEASAQYRYRVGSDALLGSIVSAGATAFKGIGSMKYGASK